MRQPPTQVILPDVIEISASRADEEVEERNRLRDMAAQAIGLGPFMISQGSQVHDDSATDEDEDQPPVLDNTEARRLGLARNSESTPNIGGGSSLSIPIPTQQQQRRPDGGRFRSGSMLAHSPSNSMTIAPIPPYPSTVSSLASFRQSSGVYSKYYPPSSLRIFALSKNWKSRFLILSSPATLVTRSQEPAVSYLHLFKSSNSDDKELERLEINEDSVVFLSEDEVGRRRHVIKVGGVDVGAMKKEYTHEEGGHTMWLLQISEPADAQSWITNIKNAIFGQRSVSHTFYPSVLIKLWIFHRTVRAGLIPAHTLGNNEPRGDMDVMLSIRAQGLVTSAPVVPSPTSRSRETMSPVPFSPTDTNPNDASSISSHSARSQTTVSKSASPTSAVSALKGLFANSGRPRSASRAASINSDRGQEKEAGEDSFTSMGSNLLSMLRSSTPETQSIITIPSKRTNLPLSGPVSPLERRIDRKILSERQPTQWVNAEPTQSMNKDRANKTFSIGALSLQPPPRKRWVSVEPTTASSHDPTSTNIDDSSRRTSLSTSVVSTEGAETEPPASPQLSNFQFGTPEQRPRAPSLQSVSTYGSNENGISIERSSSSTKRSSGTRSTRRWSRQGILPNRPTPPSIPPPAVPTTQTQSRTGSSAEQGASPLSSQSSQKSVISSLPTFSKRASGSSAHSTSSFGTSHSQQVSPSTSSNLNPIPVITRAPASHRTSMPPPRPAPTSALPPAPTDNNNQDVLKPLEPITASSKASFRTSVTNRTFRLSMGAPKPPPSTTLPPRPDEVEYKSHRRSSSGSGTNVITHPTKLETIPASPIPANKPINPFPPPAGPLPPPPTASPPTQARTPPKRSTSIKQRLRILSAPSLASGNQPQPMLHHPRPLTTNVVTPQQISTASPATPIAEKITMFQNDPSFLQMYTPILPSLPPPQSLLPHPPATQEIAEVTSLSPPPRRSSKQLLETDPETPQNILSRVESLARLSTVDEPGPLHLSLSRPGSIRSHHSERYEGDWESPNDENPSEELSSWVEKSPVMPLEPRHLSLSQPGSVVSLGIVTL